jgi:hypothetical protein
MNQEQSRPYLQPASNVFETAGPETFFYYWSMALNVCVKKQGKSKAAGSPLEFPKHHDPTAHHSPSSSKPSR